MILYAKIFIVLSNTSRFWFWLAHYDYSLYDRASNTKQDTINNGFKFHVLEIILKSTQDQSVNNTFIRSIRHPEMDTLVTEDDLLFNNT